MEWVRRMVLSLFPPEQSSPRSGIAARVWRWVRLVPRQVLRLPILAYRYSLSAFMGRQCRYLPTCSAYADEAIQTHGAWAGGWMGAARICRCHPWGGHGFDPVPERVPDGARWDRPWTYGAWRQPRAPARAPARAPDAEG